MELVHFDSDEPADHLACDELLLERAEAGELGETLRLCEIARPTVVLGVSDRWREMVHAERCAAEGVAVRRRCSGSGAVLVARGCLNYALVLDTSARPELATIRSTHRWAVERLADALSRPGVELCLAGLCDLAWGRRKVGGSAQRRKRRYVLQHGTVLCGLDLGLLGRCLRHPPDEPDYRAGRAHADFAANLPLSRQEVAGGIRRAFGIPPDQEPLDLSGELRHDVEALVGVKYGADAWTFRR